MRNPCRILLFSSVLLFSCASTPSSSSSFSPSSSVRVVLEEGEHYSCENYVVDVEKGHDATFTLNLEERYAISSVDYENASYSEVEDRVYSLTIPKVNYPTRVKIETMEVEQTIILSLNGGEFLPGCGEGEEYRYYVDDSHLRQILPAGVDRFHRPGYALIGWSLSPLGEGEVIGLGSRTDIDPHASNTRYYAIYEKEANTNLFRYTVTDEEATLTAYSGGESLENLAIPASIGGYPVTRIGSNCFLNGHFKKLILPLSLKEVAEHAFNDVEAEHLYFYSTLDYLSDESFNNCHFDKTHILLAEPTRGARGFMNTVFAEDVDRLISLKGQKKIVYFSGCSGAYSVKSPQLEEAFDGEYQVVNMGVLGDTNALTMMESIVANLEEGDILVHAPEEMSVFSLMNDLTVDARFFQLFQSNFDLLLLDSPSSYPNFFTGFADWRTIQRDQSQGSYSDRCEYVSEHGDHLTPREDSPSDSDFGLELAYGTEFLDAPTVGRLNHYYRKIREKGAKPVFSYAPINKNAVDRLDPRRVAQASFDQALHRLLDVDIISSAESSEIEGQYFYDTDYHTTDNGGIIRTERLIADLKAYLGR